MAAYTIRILLTLFLLAPSHSHGGAQNDKEKAVLYLIAISLNFPPDDGNIDDMSIRFPSMETCEREREKISEDTKLIKRHPVKDGEEFTFSTTRSWCFRQKEAPSEPISLIVFAHVNNFPPDDGEVTHEKIRFATPEGCREAQEKLYARNRKAIPLPSHVHVEDVNSSYTYLYIRSWCFDQRNP